jgi:hypothetical protein
MSSNKSSARFLTLLANLLLALSHLLPGRVREGGESSARLLRNAAHLLVQPQYVRSMMKLGLYLKLLWDVFLLLCPLAFAFVFVAFETSPLGPHTIEFSLSPLLLLVVVLSVVVFSFVFGTLINLLLISEDIYASKQDELQHTLSYKASTFTLQAVMLLLALLFVGYLFFVARMVYILKLLRLRWREMASVELTEEDSVYTL